MIRLYWYGCTRGYGSGSNFEYGSGTGNGPGLLVWAETWRRVWGDAKKFSRTILETISIFTPKNSDDLFLVIDQVFLILTVSFKRFSVSLLYQMSYITLSSQQKALFQLKKFLVDTYFLLSSSFRARPTTLGLLLKILGDQCMGRPPPQIFGEPSPSPPYVSAP